MYNLKATYKLTLLLVCVLLAGSCRKEIVPPPGPTSPVFMANGSFGGDAIMLNAGDDNVVMSTESTLLNGVDFYKGILGNDQIKVEMGIFAGNIDLANPVLPDFNSINQLSFANVQGSPQFRLVKDSFPNSQLIDQIVWEVNGEIKGINTLEIYEPGKYQICAHVTFNNYTQQTVCNEVIVGFKTSADFELNYFLSQDTFKSWVKAYGSQVQSITWYRDNEAVGSTDVLDINLSSESHFIRAEVLFANGVKRSKTILVDGTLAGRNLFDFTKPGLAPLYLWDYTVAVKVTRDGTDYYSKLASNNANKIIVNDIKYYGLNKDGDRVYILDGTVNVDVKSATGAVKPLHLNVSFGFAVK